MPETVIRLLTLDSRLLTSHRCRLNRSGSGVATSSGAFWSASGADVGVFIVRRLFGETIELAARLRQGVDFKAARQRAIRLGLLQRLHDVGIRAAQLDDRANHFVDARGDDRVAAARHPA